MRATASAANRSPRIGFSAAASNALPYSVARYVSFALVRWIFSASIVPSSPHGPVVARELLVTDRPGQATRLARGFPQRGRHCRSWRGKTPTIAWGWFLSGDSLAGRGSPIIFLKLIGRWAGRWVFAFGCALLSARPQSRGAASPASRWTAPAHAR